MLQADDSFALLVGGGALMLAVTPLVVGGRRPW